MMHYGHPLSQSLFCCLPAVSLAVPVSFLCAPASTPFLSVHTSVSFCNASAPINALLCHHHRGQTADMMHDTITLGLSPSFLLRSSQNL